MKRAVWPRPSRRREFDRPIHSSGRRVDDLLMPTTDLLLTDAQSTLLVGAAIALLVCALLGYCIGRRKDRPVLGVILGALLTVPGLLAIAVLPRKEPAYY